MKFKHGIIKLFGFPAGASGKESACQCRRRRRHELDPWVRKIPWRKKWQPASVFLPGKSHGQKSLAGYSPKGCKESDTTERLSTYLHIKLFSMLQMPLDSLEHWQGSP